MARTVINSDKNESGNLDANHIEIEYYDDSEYVDITVAHPENKTLSNNYEGDLACITLHIDEVKQLYNVLNEIVSLHNKHKNKPKIS